MITRSLNWFIDSFEKINKFKTSLSRIIELQDVLSNSSCETTKKIMHNTNHENNCPVIRNLYLDLHERNKVIVKGLNLQFYSNIKTLIQAPLGTGKSSLFKAIAKT